MRRACGSSTTLAVGRKGPHPERVRRLPTVNEGLRREATTVTTQSNGFQFEIQLGHLCNNRCVFCSSGQLSEQKIARPVMLDAIVSALDEARSRGARRVTFLGGEPTIHKGFLSALEHTVRLGFDEVVIFTNGVMFSHPGFIDRVLSLGRGFEWRVSVQGGDEASHVAVTKRADSYQRIVAGLRRLKAEGQKVTVNLCVNEKSYRSLPKFVEFVGEYGVSQLHIDVVRPSSTGLRDDGYLREIMPRYSEMAPAMREMLAGFEAVDRGFDVNIGNVPYCVLPEWGPRVHHGGEATETQTCDAEGLHDKVDKYDWQFSQRRHVASCDGCVFRPKCSGVFSEYLRLYGDKEFNAVTLEALREVDRERRNLVLLIGASVDRFCKELGLLGWLATRVDRDAVARRVRLELDRDRERLVLSFAPPSGAGEGDTVTGLFALQIESAGLGVESARAVDAVMVKVFGSETENAVTDAVDRAKRERVRARVLAVKRSLAIVARRNGWRVEVVGEQRYRLSGSAGSTVDVVLQSNEHEKPAVSVDFDVVGDTSIARARVMIDAVIAQLSPRSSARPASP